MSESFKEQGCNFKSNESERQIYLVSGCLTTQQVYCAISELKSEEVLPAHTKVRTSKYLNNLIEQDHRRVKQRIYPMLGFKRFQNAVITIIGIELAHQIRKGQFDIAKFNRSGGGASQMWDAVVAA